MKEVNIFTNSIELFELIIRNQPEKISVNVATGYFDYNELLEPFIDYLPTKVPEVRQKLINAYLEGVYARSQDMAEVDRVRASIRERIRYEL